MTPTDNLPRVIDCDLIRELKLAGRKHEAKALLKAFHESMRKSGLDARNAYDKQLRRIKKHAGICQMIGCNRKAEEGKTRCERCLRYERLKTKK